MEGGVTCSEAVERCLGHLNFRRKKPEMILQLKAILQLKQYLLTLKKKLALPEREGETTSLWGWISWAEGRYFSPRALSYLDFNFHMHCGSPLLSNTLCHGAARTLQIWLLLAAGFSLFLPLTLFNTHSGEPQQDGWPGQPTLLG